MPHEEYKKRVLEHPGASKGAFVACGLEGVDSEGTLLQAPSGSGAGTWALWKREREGEQKGC